MLTIDGVEQIVGIHSYVDGPCAVGHDQRIDRVLPFIDGYIAMVDPGVVDMPDLTPAAPSDAGTESSAVAMHGGCTVTGTSATGELIVLASILVVVAIGRRRSAISPNQS